MEILFHHDFKPLKDFLLEEFSWFNIGVLKDLDKADECLVFGKKDIIGGAEISKQNCQVLSNKEIPDFPSKSFLLYDTYQYSQFLQQAFW